MSELGIIDRRTKKLRRFMAGRPAHDKAKPEQTEENSRKLSGMYPVYSVRMFRLRRGAVMDGLQRGSTAIVGVANPISAPSPRR